MVRSIPRSRKDPGFVAAVGLGDPGQGDQRVSFFSHGVICPLWLRNNHFRAPGDLAFQNLGVDAIT